MKDKAQIDAIMAEAESASAAISTLYTHNKAANPKVSLAYLCSRAGMKSKGYLSDIMKGRRTLNPRFAAPLAAALGLTGAAARAFKLLAELESGDLEAAPRRQAEERLEVLRRSLAVGREPLPQDLAKMATVFEVYSAFGLYGNAPTMAELLRYFGERHQDTLSAALALLLRHKLIEFDGDRYRAIKTGLIFGAGTGFGHLDFLRSSLRDAERNLKRWFPRRDEAYIESVILSVKRSDYLKMLPLLRERLLESRSRLDTEKANLLVRFNVQIYPVRDQTP